MSKYEKQILKSLATILQIQRESMVSSEEPTEMNKSLMDDAEKRILEIEDLI